jgi:hypothetical protein
LRACPIALNQDFANLALMIDRAPQVNMPAGDPHDHFVEMPSIARSARACDYCRSREPHILGNFRTALRASQGLA